MKTKQRDGCCSLVSSNIQLNAVRIVEEWKKNENGNINFKKKRSAEGEKNKDKKIEGWKSAEIASLVNYERVGNREEMYELQDPKEESQRSSSSACHFSAANLHRHLPFRLCCPLEYTTTLRRVVHSTSTLDQTRDWGLKLFLFLECPVSKW